MAEEAAAPREQPGEGAGAPAAWQEKGPMFSRTGSLVMIMVIILEVALVSAAYLLIFKRPGVPNIPGETEAAEALKTGRITTTSVGEFLVNIPFDPTGREQKYLFTEISVKIAAEEAEDADMIVEEVNGEMRDIFRDQILSILRTKEFLEIQNPENEIKLKEELKTVLNQVYYERKGRKDVIDKVLFTRWEIR